jgi:hypothetical protein
MDSDEQNLISINKSQLSVVFYFKKRYESGLLLINKSKSKVEKIGNSMFEKFTSNNDDLDKYEYEILNDPIIAEKYHIIKPKFNRIVFFYGGEYAHGISTVRNTRDSLVMNLWNVAPYTTPSLQYKENNIYIITQIAEEYTINEITKYMNDICIINKVTSLHDCLLTQPNGKQLDEILFGIIMKCSEYLHKTINTLPKPTGDTGYTLLKSDTTINTQILQSGTQCFYVIIAFEDLIVDFQFFNPLVVKKNSMLIMPYSWNYVCDLTRFENNPYTYIAMTTLDRK